MLGGIAYVTLVRLIGVGLLNEDGSQIAEDCIIQGMEEVYKQFIRESKEYQACIRATAGIRK